MHVSNSEKKGKINYGRKWSKQKKEKEKSGMKKKIMKQREPEIQKERKKKS